MVKFAANLTMMFTEAPFPDRFAAAAKAGFAAVEYMSPYPYAAEELQSRLADCELSQVLFNLPVGDWAAGDRGYAVHASRKGEFRDGVAMAVDYAKVLGCTQVNCLSGVSAGPEYAGSERDALIDNLAFAADALKTAGVRLLIEPINTRDIPGFFLTHSRQALDLIAEIGSDNLYLQYDIYHMQVMEGDLAQTMAAHLPLISHIQLADNPGRHEPGTGEINYRFLFEHLDRIGYEGWIGAEYRPATTTEVGLGWFAPYRRP